MWTKRSRDVERDDIFFYSCCSPEAPGIFNGGCKAISLLLASFSTTNVKCDAALTKL